MEQEEEDSWETGEILPEDLLIEIAARLPAKSVMRFKCISNFWSTLPLSRNFCNRFLMYQQQQQQPPRLYMSLVNRIEYTKSLLLSSSSISTSTCPSLEFHHQDVTIREIGGNLLHILRGFICFTLNNRARIYNPSTRQLVILPPIQESYITGLLHFTRCFICHDPVGDQYKLLCIITATLPREEDVGEEEEEEEDQEFPETTSEHWVFVLEAGGSWKRLETNDFQTRNHRIGLQQVVTMNKFLYYVAWTDSQTCLLVSFNIRSEELSMIQVPRKAGDLLSRLDKRLILINHAGKLAVFDFSFLKEDGMVDLWVVEDWRNKEWSRKTLILQPCQLHLFTHHYFKAKGTTTLQGGSQVIFMPQFLMSPFYFVFYDLQTNHLKKVEISGIPHHWFTMLSFYKCFDVEFMDPTENVKYLES